MTFEVTCGHCNGRLRVEQSGTVVACPHCGTHLTIADPDVAPATGSIGNAPVPVAGQSDPVPEKPESDFTASTFSSPAAGIDDPISADNAVTDFPDFSNVLPDATDPTDGSVTLIETPVEPAFAASILDPPAGFTAPINSKPNISNPVPVSPDGDSHAWSGNPTQAAPDQVQTTTGPGASTTASPITTPPRQSKAFTLLASYASLVTILAIWLFLQTRGNPSELENLPDIEPERGKNGKIGFNLTREDASMPAGHTLSLGEERRFGNLKVTALRVTRSTLEFDHFDPTENEKRESVPGVLKLWLRFENVSADQRIAPLRGLVFKRHFDMVAGIDRANNFVCRTSQKKPDGDRILVFDHTIAGVFDIRGMNFRQEIAPGQSLETFIPTTAEGVDALFVEQEPLVWRIHFRKGYSPNRYGVTTLFEVRFSGEEVGAEQDSVPVEAEPETPKQA